MKMTNAMYFPDVEQWHNWLEQHHASEKEAWVIFYKVETNQPSIAYEAAVEEALCFGWIDSIIQKLDEQRYARKFTPRTNTAKWSVPNRRRVAKLLREGRMTPAGMAKIEDPSEFREDLVEEKRAALEIPSELERALQANPTARENFSNMAPSYRRNYIYWITSAKRPETVERRVREALEKLEQNLPLGMK
jgi:uncharacterized protein YdeI (YjbR/CyaY-like superfamily)